MDNGARVFVGGLEASDEARGDNPHKINHIVDCRGYAFSDRWGEPHMPKQLPDYTSHQCLGINRLSITDDDGHSLRYMDEFENEFRPLVEKLIAGKSVLLHCTNGTHRAPRVGVLLFVGLLGLDEDARNRSGTCCDSMFLGRCDMTARGEFGRLRAICEFNGVNDRQLASQSAMA